MDPLVSVIIPVYNRPTELQRAIQSVLSQSYTNYEVIVVDDGSECEIVNNYSDQRIKILKHEKNMGTAAARNTGIKAASGKYIANLDSDDCWYPNKLEKQVAYKETVDDTVKAICTRFHLTRVNSKFLEIRGLNSKEDFSDTLLNGCFLSQGTTILFEKSIMDQVGWYDTALPRFQDWDWLLRYCQHFNLEVMEEPLAVVNVGAYPSFARVRKSINILYLKHYKEIRKRKGLLASLRFKSSVMLEQAIYATREKKYLCSAYYLFLSGVLYPPRMVTFLRRVIQKYSSREIQDS